MNIDNFNKLITRALGLTWLFGAMTIPTIAVLGWLLYQSNQTIEHMTKDIPIMVVPGAIAGVYTAGINEENLLNACRYVSGLGTNFTRKNATEHLEEIEKMADPSYLVPFQSIKSTLLKEVEDKSESRTFSEVLGTAKLVRNPDNTYMCVIRGERTILSAGLVMDSDVAEASLTFKLSSPSMNNKWGIAILGLNVAAVQGTSQKQGNAQNTLKGAN